MFSFFNFFDGSAFLDSKKQLVFLITDLYYQRGDATYYFDREFIIIGE